ncbi:MAG: phosphoribosyl-AMP cyclohydrolase [Clostridia bacterium]|nr:phosphoribosyl-AMP cyclohydrolase [Clostridia bacterium]MBN2883078.1 phosphoribosyl-AMP cyclohydrolase [Clostridia bacterium]
MSGLDDLKYNDDGLIPVVAQDVETGQVLMQAYAKKEQLQKTLEKGTAHYFSRSRNKEWHKGETSGHFQKVEQVKVDCDNDCILYIVRQEGSACHTGKFSCFYRSLDKKGDIIDE